MVLAWPGAKTRLIKKILPLIPKKMVCSPFFGGGSVELELAKTRIVRGYDIMPSLVNFWQQILDYPKTVAQIARTYYPMNKKRFIQLQNEYKNPLYCLQAAQFYILSNTSVYAMMTNYGQNKLTKAKLDDLGRFSRPNLSVGLETFQDSIPKNEDAFLYCDPPYYEHLLDKRVYRDPTWATKPPFDHDALAELLHKRDSWILHYDDCEKVQELYAGYDMIRFFYRYGMGNHNMSDSELIIMSRDVKTKQTNISQWT